MNNYSLIYGIFGVSLIYSAIKDDPKYSLMALGLCMVIISFTIID